MRASRARRSATPRTSAAAFSVITRFADAIGARPHSEAGLTREQAIAHEGRFFDLGYA